jgi:hypothetical protein
MRPPGARLRAAHRHSHSPAAPALLRSCRRLPKPVLLAWRALVDLICLRGLRCPGGGDGLRLTFHRGRSARRAALISRTGSRSARRRCCAVAAIGRGSSFRHRRLSVRLPSLFNEMVTLSHASRRPTPSPHPQIGLRPDSSALQVSAEQIWRTGGGVTGAHPACGEIPARHWCRRIRMNSKAQC